MIKLYEQTEQQAEQMKFNTERCGKAKKQLRRQEETRIPSGQTQEKD